MCSRDFLDHEKTPRMEVKIQKKNMFPQPPPSWWIVVVGGGQIRAEWMGISLWPFWG